MDRLIKRFDSFIDRDLALCEHRGVAYQHDMRRQVAYDSSYLSKCEAYAGSEIASEVNRGRCELIKRHLLGGEASLIDVGCGTGDFMREFQRRNLDFKVGGFDVIPEVVAELRAQERFCDDFRRDVVTLWDSIEHMPAPEIVLKRVQRGALLCVSVPVFESLRDIRASKHYRPGEHLYYWTSQGFIDWMSLYGFRLLEASDHEVRAGRESIGAFAFRRDLPDYHDHLLAYQEIHASKHYGDSATEFHLKDAARVVRALAPRSILDFGCGRSDLASHFWLDGKRRIERYDPAIPRYKEMPKGEFDLVFCCDVLEHIPMSCVDSLLDEVRSKSSVALFTISTKLAKAKLPDGRNAHVTLLLKSEWTRWLIDVFGIAQVLPSEWPHVLIVLAGSRKQVSLT